VVLKIILTALNNYLPGPGGAGGGGGGLRCRGGAQLVLNV